MADLKLFKMKLSITVFTIFCLMGIIHLNCNTKPDKKLINTIPEQTLGTEQHLEWFRDAKFGMFIHWGPYSRLAGEWNGRKVPVEQLAEPIMDGLQIPVKTKKTEGWGVN